MFPQHSKGHCFGFINSFWDMFMPSSVFLWHTSHLQDSIPQKAASLPLPLQ